MNMNIKELKRRAGISEDDSDLSNLFFNQQGAVGANKTVLGKLAQQLKSVHDFIDQTETIRDHQMDTLLDSIRTLAYLDHMVAPFASISSTLQVCMPPRIRSSLSIVDRPTSPTRHPATSIPMSTMVRS